jgi:hypothetical protein
MCELEQHVLMLRECGGPLSPSRILLHMRKINHQIGDGSQEDAHEFLRSSKDSLADVFILVSNFILEMLVPLCFIILSSYLCVLFIQASDCINAIHMLGETGW